MNLFDNIKNSKFCFFNTDNGILLNGNALDVFKIIPDSSIDLIVTSPPYNVGIDYDNWNDTLPIEKYFEFVESFLKEFKRILKTDGRFVINIPLDTNMKHLGYQYRVSLLCEYYALIKKVDLQYNSIIELYESTPHRVKFTAFGSFMSASAPYIYNPKEYLLVGCNQQWKKNNKGKSDITKEEFMEIVTGIWNYKADTRWLTKANFSIDIPYKAIKAFSYVGDVVLDPFMGSGTTAVVAEQLNRKWIGIEISKNYCEIAKNRITNEICKLF